MTKIKNDLSQKIEALEAKNQELQTLLDEAHEAIRAISTGEIDALVVYGDNGERVYTLQGADYAYRVMVESIHEGAANIKSDGTILYCNKQLAEMLKRPLETILGSSFYDYLIPAEQRAFTELTRKGFESFGRAEFNLASQQADDLSVLITASAAEVDGRRGICLVVTDLTEQKHALARERELQHHLTKQREEERIRIARDLHDGPLQDLIVLSFLLHEKISDSQGMDDDLVTLRGSILKLIGELRNVCNDLRPPNSIRLGLAKAIQQNVDEIRFKHPQLAFDLELFQTDQSISENTSTLLFRIYQESINNIIRHSGATTVKVSLTTDEYSVKMKVQDNGKGFQPPEDWTDLSQKGHLGMVGMRERAEAAGGKIQISSCDKGTTVYVEVPHESNND